MKILFIVLFIIFCIILMKKNSKNRQIIAIANIKDMNGINGNVLFYQKSDNTVLIDINLVGLPKNAILGFHIHEAGDITDGCKSACAHFNPFNTVHGGPKSRNRHVGDLGNIYTDNNGNCKMKFKDHMIKLDGSTSNIIGRSIVIHDKIDDLGRGKNKESLITGNAGKRIACSVIGYSRMMFNK
jgi:Cu-Zn family superoxide dismutase